MKKIYEADFIIIGAGIFGLYAAFLLTKHGKKVIIFEKSLMAFARASSINQARVHNGYHYPRSYQTAKKASFYYNRFIHDFGFAINSSFKQIYAISSNNSKTTSKEFIDFCHSLKIQLKEIDSEEYFIKGSVESAFIVDEYSFDFNEIKEYLLKNINVGTQFFYDAHIKTVEKNASFYTISLSDGISCTAPVVINATYSGINNIINQFGHKNEKFNVKYELCEMAFCEVPQKLRNVGITVMDGEYFSFMPFGNSKLHSFTSVEHTPHYIPYDTLCAQLETSDSKIICTMHHIRGCVACAQNIRTAWQAMGKLYKTYIKSSYSLKYLYSQYEVKIILTKSEKDDSRPTIIKKHTTSPTFISVLSGKLSTIYDLEKYL
ncbi:MAG: FAD-dependent oxidoreductase [bacterium]|nr:FAD-dependent oxidoreductase [bacterium]